jgi:transcriptional regulator with XRE-family HTH domain
MITGQIIKQILKEKGLKISWLAEQLKMSNSTLSTRLNGDLKVDFTLQICNLINISLDDLYARYKNLNKGKE